MENKKLIIKKNGNDLFFKYFDNARSYFKYSSKNIIFRVFRKLDLPLNCFFGDWKKDIKEYDKVIFFDNGYNKQVAEYIKKKNPNIKTIFWYWNSLIEYNNKLIDDKNIDEIWTYSKNDAETFNIKYNTPFYHKINEENNTDFKENRAVFLGRNKGREEKISKIQKILEDNNIECNFNIINDEKLIPYENYIEDIKKSGIILDINISEKSGLSLRPLEALFYNKKLITNNTEIITYDFYDSNNIFVLGIDDINKLDAFLIGKYKKIDKDIIEKYEFENWLSRF